VIDDQRTHPMSFANPSDQPVAQAKGAQPSRETRVPVGPQGRDLERGAGPGLPGWEQIRGDGLNPLGQEEILESLGQAIDRFLMSPSAADPTLSRPTAGPTLVSRGLARLRQNKDQNKQILSRRGWRKSSLKSRERGQTVRVNRFFKTLPDRVSGPSVTKYRVPKSPLKTSRVTIVIARASQKQPGLVLEPLSHLAGGRGGRRTHGKLLTLT
jgi:hypothetical protein